MRIGRAVVADGVHFARSGAGDEQWLDLGLDAGGRQDEILRGVGLEGRGQLPAPVRWLAPLRPNRIFAIGRNYRAHAQERGEQVPTSPVVWNKLSSAVVGPGDKVQIPAEHRDAIDYEGELAVVIGRRGPRIDAPTPLGHLPANTVATDVTGRVVQDGMAQWMLPKSMPTFAPLGPWMVTADEVPDPQALSIETFVNGERRQAGNTAEMIFPVAHLISFLSQYVELEVGDVIETGTPAGVGWSRRPPAMLQPGHEVEVRIERVGVLRNPVVAEDGPFRAD